MSLTNATTVVAMFHHRVQANGAEPALLIKRRGQFQPVTWDELSRDIMVTAAALTKVGVQPGDRVVQLSENRYEWIVSDLAIQIAQAVHVPLHAALTGQQVAYQINDSGAPIVLLSAAGQAEKLAGVAGQLPSGLQFVSYDKCKVKIGKQPVRPLCDLTAARDEESGRQLEQQALANLTNQSLATILYTSGTTGEPKGVMLSHGNLASNAQAILQMFEESSDDVRLSFLPHSHIFARTCDVYTWLASGCRLALAESRETILADCEAVRPTLINGVPYFFDKVCRAILDRESAGQHANLSEMLGGRVRLCCSGGAPLTDHVFDFFNGRGVTLAQGYGLTETSPVITVSTATANKRGCVGRAIPGVEVRIADDGEILTRGPHVMLGYYKDQAATDETIRDGWLYTGDLGELDTDGFLKITGRKKEIIVTSGGKNVAPVLIESLLTQDPLIIQAVVFGDGRDYLTALIVPDPDRLRAEIIARKIRVFSKKQAVTHPKVLALYEQRIQERLATVSYYEQVQKFTLCDRGFTVESGELTPKLSLRRDVIQRNFADQIAAMYSE